MMAGSESQTELMSGWSCIVHQPSDDPEPSELPSTVDMAAFSSGLPVDGAATTATTNSTQQASSTDDESESESDTNVSKSEESGSYSDSSDSDSTTSSHSTTSRSQSPEFSVTSSKTNDLRLTFAPVRKSISIDEVPTKQPSNQIPAVVKKPQSQHLLGVKSSSVVTTISDDSNDVAASKTNKVEVAIKAVNAKVNSKCSIVLLKKKGVVKSGKDKEVVANKKSAGKVKSSSGQQENSNSSSDSSNQSDSHSAMLASCSLQEIRQEDLAAILPDQQECETFGGFESRAEKNSTQAGDGSESDIELPQQDMNALILRTTESSSDSECNQPVNPSSLCANSLLQQFVEQTQRLNLPSATSSRKSDLIQFNGNKTAVSNAAAEESNAKRKRGRPRKQQSSVAKSVLNKATAYANNPNVSPDSGIQNSPDHGFECSPTRSSISKNSPSKVNVKSEKSASTENSPKKTLETASKLPITSDHFDRVLYGNADRVLYPPRRRKVGRPPANKPVENTPVIIKSTKVEEEKAADAATTQLRHRKQSKPHASNNGAAKQIANKAAPSYLSESTVINGRKQQQLQEICERVSRRLSQSNSPLPNPSVIKSLKNKSHKIIVRANNNKHNHSKQRCIKLVHSKHKYRKHGRKKKSRRRANTVPDPKLLSDIDKLVQDFINLCIVSSSTNTAAKENVPEVLRALRKACKKRKPSEHNDRKKKKQNLTSSVDKEANSNEQRLPLKKRHYHLSTNKEDDKEKESEDVQRKETADSASNAPLIESANTNCSVNPVKSERADNCHIDEAIEACINKYKSPTKSAETTEVNITNVTVTTPKKRHRMEPEPILKESPPERDAKLTDSARKRIRNFSSIENVVSKLKLKRNLSSPSDKKEEIITRTRVSISKDKEEVSKTSRNGRASFEATVAPAQQQITTKKKKLEKLEELQKAVIIDDKMPTGIFLPTVDLDAHLPLNSPSTIEEIAKPLSFPTIVKLTVPLDVAAPDIPVKTTDVAASPKRKVRKRRAINRTGFPTIKKKKKKPEINREVPKVSPITDPSDRVPKDGEKYSTFVQRTEKISVVALEKLQQQITVEPTPLPTNFTSAHPQVSPNEPTDPSTVITTKWEVLSECDSLPQEDRIDYISSANIASLIAHNNIQQQYDSDDDDSMDDLSLEARMARYSLKRKRGRREVTLGGGKRRLRDVSPASSGDWHGDRRFRDSSSWSAGSGDELLFRKGTKIPRWRKKYLTAGLFSDHYKVDEADKEQNSGGVRRGRNQLETLSTISTSSSGSNNGQKQQSWTKLVYRPDEHPYGLLPAPYHCGKFLRCSRVDFLLPYDLWWQHTHGQLVGRDIVPSWNYRKIRSNVYNVKNTSMACEPQSCNCKKECEDDCINRLVLSECPPTHKCKNQRIQKHEWAPGIEKYMTDNKGWGVRTHMSINSGEFILEYIGEVVSDHEFKQRMSTLYTHDTHHYCLHLDGLLVIDGHRMGGDGRFVNHSCEPNCEMQKWTVNGQYRMALFALRDIEAGEEITYDYNFSLFNAAEGQECKCGSEQCRGVIGGKSQRVRNSVSLPSQPVKEPGTGSGPGRVGRPRKIQVVAKKATSTENDISPALSTIVLKAEIAVTMVATTLTKPLSHAQRTFVLERRCFLMRNLNKMKRNKNRTVPPIQQVPSRTATPSNTDQSTNYIHHLNALKQPRNMKTRTQAIAEVDPELKNTWKLAQVLRDLLNIVTEAKDEKEAKLCEPFLTIPPKKKSPEYHLKIDSPIDLSIVEQNVSNGVYKSADMFDTDMNRLFTNALRYHGISSDMGLLATRLKGIYQRGKKELIAKLENREVFGKQLGFSKKKDEDIIRCICGMFRDEGMMIQCERCLVWQHCECVRADSSAASYHCERCVPRPVDYEIAMDEYTEHGHRYYMTLMRGSLQLAQGDTVYVLRDIPIPGTDRKHTYDTIGDIPFEDLDIFRIERLWKDKDSGQRLAYGHHYLRPHETYHEPTRRFFHNEVMRVPLYEAVPVDLVIRHCWVLDLNTFCKGRPIGAPERHIYICEMRVDKSARLFSKVARSKYPSVCTKSYAFERFEQRLKPTRTYAPHELKGIAAQVAAQVRHRGRKPNGQNNQQSAPSPQPRETVNCALDDMVNKKVLGNTLGNNVGQNSAPIPNVATVKGNGGYKSKLNDILLQLLSKLPTKKPVDLSYLLEGGRRKKRIQFEKIGS